MINSKILCSSNVVFVVNFELKSLNWFYSESNRFLYSTNAAYENITFDYKNIRNNKSAKENCYFSYGLLKNHEVLAATIS